MKRSMLTVGRPVGVAIFLLGVVSLACNGGADTQSPSSDSPTADANVGTPIASPTAVADSSTEKPAEDQASTAPRPTVIFHNGQVVTVEEDLPFAEALAIEGETIIAVGLNEDVLALATTDTQLIDLEGRALLPGFVDAHTHSLGGFEQLEENQRHVLAGGVTTVGETAMSPSRLDSLRSAVESVELKVRTRVYLTYNSKCNGLEPAGWYLDYPARDQLDERLQVLGIKIFADPAGPNTRCGWAAMSIELPPDFADERNAGPYGELLLSEAELTEVISEHQDLGYQVIIHVRGDVVLDAALNAFDAALAGQPNDLRHRIEHNDYIRPNQLSRYGEIGVLPTLRGRPLTCLFNAQGGVHPFGETVHPWYGVAQSLIEANPGLPVAWHSDTGPMGRWPILDLYDLITRRQVRSSDGELCEPPDWLAADVVRPEDALRMMTINGAYALFMEDDVGSLRPGKLADLIILSDNPLTIDVDMLPGVEVIMTMVGGQVEHCLSGHEPLCPR